jgi:hypothetical protein
VGLVPYLREAQATSLSELLPSREDGTQHRPDEAMHKVVRRASGRAGLVEDNHHFNLTPFRDAPKLPLCTAALAHGEGHVRTRSNIQATTSLPRSFLRSLLGKWRETAMPQPACP